METFENAEPCDRGGQGGRDDSRKQGEPRALAVSLDPNGDGKLTAARVESDAEIIGGHGRPARAGTTVPEELTDWFENHPYRDWGINE
jgi:hypothetical protein